MKDMGSAISSPSSVTFAAANGIDVERHDAASVTASVSASRASARRAGRWHRRDEERALLRRVAADFMDLDPAPGVHEVSVRRCWE